MKVINGVKKYLVKCHDIENNESIKVYWSSQDFAFAEYLAMRGFLGIIPGLGYVYKLSELQKGIHKLTPQIIQSFYK